jgi:3-oxoadipate enol-lactonase
VKVDYRCEGPEGSPALVLSNSLGTTSDLWDPQLTGLASRFRVIRYDHRGHGRSPAPSTPTTVEALADDVLEILDRLQLDRVSFCGLSLGGMVGMALALAAPDRVDRLLLACTAAYLGPPEGWEERARRVRADGTTAIAEAVVRRWFTDEFRRAHPSTVTRFREMLEATSREGYAGCCEAIRDWDARERIDAIAVPTLVIAGADDPAIPAADSAYLAETIPAARLVVLPGAAHLANVEQPELFNRALLEHLLVHPSSEEAA